MLAGAALECALKGRIMHHLGLNRWPSRTERRDLYTHDLTELAELAGVRIALEKAAANSEPLGVGWMVAKDFSINRRYPTG